MNIENKDPREIAEIVEDTMSEFNSAMQRRESLIIGIAEQTNQIIRFSMIGLSLSAAAVFTLLIILLSDMGNINDSLNEISSYMQDISQNLTVMAENVYEVKHSLDNLNQYVKVMPVMNDSVGKISKNIININFSINKINSSVMVLNGNLDLIQIDLARMSHQVSGLNNHLGVMSYNTERIVTPMKFFPFQ